MSDVLIKDINFSFADLPMFVSFDQKKADNFRRAKQMMEYYDFSQGTIFNQARDEKYLMNYRLYNGRWDNIEKQGDHIGFKAGNEQINIKSGVPLRHYPIIDRVAKSVVSNVILTPLIPMVMDGSPAATNERQRTQLQLLQQYFQQTVIEPIRQNVTNEYLQEFGITDVYSLAPEEQEQMRADIESRTASMTPKEISHYMSKDYRTRDEKALQRFLNHVVKEQHIKHKEVVGFEHAVCTGVEAYRIWTRANEPLVEVLKPRFLDYGLAAHSDFIEDGEYAKYQQWLRHTDLLNRHPDLARGDVKELLDLFTPFGNQGYKANENPEIRKRFVEEMKFNPELKGVDYRVKEGQDKLWEVYERVGQRYANGWGIRECHIAWRWNRDLYLVARLDKKTGKKKEFWRSADIYEPSFSNGDIEWKKVTVPEVWQGTKLGIVNAKYVGIEPLPNQFKNLDNPFDVKLPYYGSAYNNLMGEEDNIALIDLGKPYQYRYNVQMQRIDEYESTNIGKVLLATANMKPDDWSWDEWWASLRVGKVAMIRTHGEGPNAIDAQFFREIDLSNMRDIGAALDLLREWEDKTYTAMYYNRAQIGQASQYKGLGENQIDMQASEKQLAKLYDRHNEIVNRMLNGLLCVIKNAYGDNDIKKTVLLDDGSRADLEINMSTISLDSMNIFVSNDLRDQQKVRDVKMQLLPFIQNQYGSLGDITKLIMADTTSDIMDVADEVERKMKESQLANAENQERMERQLQEQQMQLVQMQAEMDMAKQAQKDEAALQRVLADTPKFAMQFDIDGNKVNDAYDKAILEIAAKKQMEDEKLEVEREKIASKEKIEMEKIKNIPKVKTK
jgi:hypothetical protein